MLPDGSNSGPWYDEVILPAIALLEAAQGKPDHRIAYGMADLMKMSESDLMHLQSKGAIDEGERIEASTRRWMAETEAKSNRIAERLEREDEEREGW